MFLSVTKKKIELEWNNFQVDSLKRDTPEAKEDRAAVTSFHNDLEEKMMALPHETFSVKPVFKNTEAITNFVYINHKIRTTSSW